MIRERDRLSSENFGVLFYSARVFDTMFLSNIDWVVWEILNPKYVFVWVCLETWQVYTFGGGVIIWEAIRSSFVDGRCDFETIESEFEHAEIKVLLK